jgi:hypothetical protein
MFIKDHMNNVMAFLGVELYFYDSVFVTVSPNEVFEIDAFNDFYFLAGIEYHLNEDHRGFTLIEAENTIVEIGSDSNIQTAIYTEHFTGRISISLKPYGDLSGDVDNMESILTGKCTLNFLRVTPTSLFDDENPRKQNKIFKANS